MKKFERSKKDIVFTGLLGGVGEYFEVDPVLVRLFFIFFILITGFFPGVLFYLMAMLLVPEKLEGKGKKVVHSEVDKL